MLSKYAMSHLHFLCAGYLWQHNIRRVVKSLPSSSKRQSRPGHSWLKSPAWIPEAPAKPAISIAVWRSSQKLELATFFLVQLPVIW